MSRESIEDNGLLVCVAVIGKSDQTLQQLVSARAIRLSRTIDMRVLALEGTIEFPKTPKRLQVLVRRDWSTRQCGCFAHGILLAKKMPPSERRQSGAVGEQWRHGPSGLSRMVAAEDLTGT
jgi:hypothetical protein